MAGPLDGARRFDVAAACGADNARLALYSFWNNDVVSAVGSTMMEDEDGAKTRPVSHVVGEDLSTLSVDELHNRIELLEGEIVRLTRSDRKEKQATRSAADQLFKQ